MHEQTAFHNFVTVHKHYLVRAHGIRATSTVASSSSCRRASSAHVVVAAGATGISIHGLRFRSLLSSLRKQIDLYTHS